MRCTFRTRGLASVGVPSLRVRTHAKTRAKQPSSALHTRESVRVRAWVCSTASLMSSRFFSFVCSCVFSWMCVSPRAQMSRTKRSSEAPTDEDDDVVVVGEEDGGVLLRADSCARGSIARARSWAGMANPKPYTLNTKTYLNPMP